MARLFDFPAECNKVSTQISHKPVCERGQMTTSLSEDSLRDLVAPLAQANKDFAARYPGEAGKRQPVHTVYGGAHLFKSDSAGRLGALARRSLDQFAPDFMSFAKAVAFGGADQLPESPEEDGGLLSQLETDREQVR